MGHYLTVWLVCSFFGGGVGVRIGVLGWFTGECSPFAIRILELILIFLGSVGLT